MYGVTQVTQAFYPSLLHTEREAVLYTCIQNVACMYSAVIIKQYDRTSY